MDYVDHGNQHAEQMIDQQIAKRVRYHGTSRKTCIDCDDDIPEGRRQPIAGCSRCTDCQDIHDRRSRR